MTLGPELCGAVGGCRGGGGGGNAVQGPWRPKTSPAGLPRAGLCLTGPSAPGARAGAALAERRGRGGAPGERGCRCLGHVREVLRETDGRL